MVDACRLAGFKMTHAKMGVFILGDGYDHSDGRPLVKVNGTSKQFRSFVRLANGAPDIASRARFDKWSIDLQVEFDTDMFSADDVAAPIRAALDAQGLKVPDVRVRRVEAIPRGATGKSALIKSNVVRRS